MRASRAPVNTHLSANTALDLRNHLPGKYIQDNTGLSLGLSLPIVLVWLFAPVFRFPPLLRPFPLPLPASRVSGKVSVEWGDIRRKLLMQNIQCPT